MSFLEPIGSTFAARGGLNALNRREQEFARMQQVAWKMGHMETDQEAPDPTGFKSMFFKIVDFISRPNYAIAGVKDTLQGTGREGEYAAMRAVRELFSGSFGLEGDKEAWGQVLEQAGWGEGGHLSDLIGENGLTRNFNPSTRDAVGLALDIFTDPTTYISAPVKNAAVVFGSGGEVRFLNKAGRAARAAKYEQKLEHWRTVLELPDNMSELRVLDRIAQADDFRKAQGKVSASIVQAGDNFGRSQVKMVLDRQVGEELLAESAATGGQRLFEKTGLRFRPLGLVDIPLGVDKALARVSSVMWEGMKRTDMGARVAKTGEETFLALDAVFNHVPFLARKNKQFWQLRQFQHMRYNAAEHVAKLEAEELMTGVHRKLWDDRDLWRGFVRMLEANDPRADQVWYRMAKAKGIEHPEAFMQGWRDTFDRIGLVELRTGFMTEAQYAATRARYFHRIIDRFDPKIRKQVNVEARQGSTRPGLGGSQHEARAFEGWMDFEKHMITLGAKEDQIVLNPFEVAATRLRLHYEDMATASFLDELEPLFGFKTTQTHKRVKEILKSVEREGELTDAHIADLDGIEARSSTLNPDDYDNALEQELTRIFKESDEGKAVQRIEEMVDGLTKDLDPILKRLEVERATDEWRRMQRAYLRADLFDATQSDKAARAEIALHREVKKDLKAQEQYLRRWARKYKAEYEDVMASAADDVLPEYAIVYRDIEGTEMVFDPYTGVGQARAAYGRSVWGDAVIEGPVEFTQTETRLIRQLQDLAQRKAEIDEWIGINAIRDEIPDLKDAAKNARKQQRLLERQMMFVERKIRKERKAYFEKSPKRELARAQQKVYDLQQTVITRRKRARNAERAGKTGQAQRLRESALRVEQDELPLAIQRAKDARVGIDEARSFGTKARPVEETQWIASQARASMHLFDEATERIGEWEEVLDKYLQQKKISQEDYKQLLGNTREQIKVVRAAYKQYWKEFEEQVVRDVTGTNVTHLMEQQRWLQAEVDKLMQTRTEWALQKAAIRDEIATLDHVFNPLKSRVRMLTERRKLLVAKRSAARKDLVEARALFREMNPSSAKQLKEADLAKLRAMPKHVQAAFILRGVEQIDTIVHFENFMGKYAEVLRDIDPELNELARRMTRASGDLTDRYGQPYQTITIRTSPRLKETINEDIAIREAQAYRETVSDQYDLLKSHQDDINKQMKEMRDAKQPIPEELRDRKKAIDHEVKTAREMRKSAKEDWAAAKRARAAVPAMGGNKEFYLPKGIVDDLKNLEGVLLENEEIRTLLGIFDRFNNWFKLAVTRYFISFHVRNAYSNVAASFTDIGMEALNPQRAKQAFDILRGADGTFRTATGRKIPYSMIREEIDILNIRVDKNWLAEQTGPIKVRPSDPMEWVIDKGLRHEGAVEFAAGAAQKAWAVPMNVENHARVMHYIALRRRGFTMQDAAMQVNKFLFDYNALSPTERGVFRRLFPFWTWTRKNVERQIKNLYENPGRIATQTKIFAGDRGPDGDNLPEYARGQLNTKLRSGPDGEVWLTNMDLPIANLDVLWAGGFGKTFKEQIGLLTPILKTPFEVGVGQEFFTGQSLRGVGRIRPELGRALSRNLPKVMEDYFELKNIGTEQEPDWRINRLKFHIATQATFMSRMVSEVTRFEEFVQDLGNGDAASGAKVALRILSGLNLRSYDMEEKHRAMVYNRARRLEELLVGTGDMESFTRPYIPERTKEAVGLPTGRQGTTSANPFGGGGGF